MFGMTVYQYVAADVVGEMSEGNAMLITNMPGPVACLYRCLKSNTDIDPWFRIVDVQLCVMNSGDGCDKA